MRLSDGTVGNVVVGKRGLAWEVGRNDEMLEGDEIRRATRPQ